ncbi:phosphotransferase [Candidatus Kaiserbacteria bacterium]|nr:phosphotransferase [Candidatus Kaiserbacteria bacterium]
MSLDAILDLAKQVDSGIEVKDITPLQGGFSSQAYKVDRGDRPFVLLVERPGSVSPSNYGHAYTVITLLQKHNFKYAPLPLWLKEDHKALAISFFDGVASDTFNFDSNHIDSSRVALEVIDSLLDTASITLDEYENTAKNFGVEPLPIESPMDGARKYGTVWLDIVRKSCPDEDIVAWLEPRVERSIELAKTMGNNPPVFGHGDPSNPNILLRQDGSFMLIDWDSARFHTSGPEFFVAYTTNLTDFMKPYREVLTSHVAQKIGVSVEEFTHRVHEYRRYTEVFDVNWAAMMMARINAGEVSGDIHEFRAIAQERMKIYDSSFGGVL